MTCSECKNSFHLGHYCAGISKSTFNAMGQVNRDKWQCRFCRAQESRKSQTDEESGSQGGEPCTYAAQLTMLTEKMDPLLSMRQNVETLVRLPTKVDVLLLLNPTVEQLKIIVATVQASIEFSNKYDSLLDSVIANETTPKELWGKTSSLRSIVQINLQLLSIFKRN